VVVLLSLEISFNHGYEVIFAIFEPLDEGLPWVSRKVLALYHIVMQVVSEVLSAYVAPVPVEDPEETYLGPLAALPALVLGLEDI
jgi:hypothetical protein